MSEVNLEMAKTIYGTVCTALDNLGLHYKKVEEDLVITFGLKGDDMNHDLLVVVNPQKEVIQIIEKLPFAISAEKASDIAIAMSYANDVLLNGKFTSDLKQRINYEVTQIYSGSLIGEETIKRMILALVYTVEEYDDKFFALNKGYITAESFGEKK